MTTQNTQPKAGHTPRPWRARIWDCSHSKPARKDLVIETRTLRLAILDWDEIGDNPYTVPRMEAEANARLIAAAPELLDACLFAQAMEDNRRAGVVLDDDDYSELHDRLTHAITKATA